MLKIFYSVFVLVVCGTSCTSKTENPNTEQMPLPIMGTWKLLSGTIIKGADTTFTDYTKNQELIKIINKTHFAFLRHDLGQDSIAVFVSGGGRCKIGSTKYTEYLDFCNFREWENNTFDFDYKINGDTLITTGIEKIEELKINQFNIEKFVRIKE